MNAIPPLAPAPDRALHTRRCVRHVGREAAVRCPECARFFCRECVVEHDGRLLCVECLARVTRRTGSAPRDWKRVRRTAALAVSALLAWTIFYGIGSLLLKIPPSFHEGNRPTTGRHSP